MAHHKRKRAKNQRAGCLLCKPHKANGAKDKTKAALAALETLWAEEWALEVRDPLFVSKNGLSESELIKRCLECGLPVEDNLWCFRCLKFLDVAGR